MPQAFPGETFRNHIGILEKADSKTAAAESFAGRLMNEGRRLCVIDPGGVWRGLRLCAITPVLTCSASDFRSRRDHRNWPRATISRAIHTP